MPTVDTAPGLLLKNILFATDFSAASDKACTYAAVLARKYGSKVTVTHVLPEHPPGVSPADQLSESDEQVMADAERCLADFKCGEVFRGVAHEELLLQGDIIDTLTGTVEQRRIDLLVLGTHGRSGINDLIMGSVAERIFRHLSCPVLTVGPKCSFAEPHTVNLERVLFATDLAHGPHALPYALSLAQENNAQLIMLHVIQGALMFEDVVPEEWSEQAKKHMREMLPADLELQYEPLFLTAEGIPGDAIVEVAIEQRADIIVMGVHSGPPSSSHAPWAIAHRVVGRAPCPVLTVKGAVE